MDSVFLAIPCFDLKVNSEMIGPVLQASPKGQVRGMKVCSYSLLPRNFNELFCAALNARKDGITHFCMLHSDIVPHQAGWVDILLDEMNKYQADVISVVVPLKSNTGLTSIALDEQVAGSDADPHWRPRRLTMTEIMGEFPDTFTNEKLLINTGIMLVDLRKPWVENIHFTTEDIIMRKTDGTFYAENVPEDWLFSRHAKAKGAKLFATRKVGCTHYGHQGWVNAYAFGSKKTDSHK